MFSIVWTRNRIVTLTSAALVTSLAACALDPESATDEVTDEGQTGQALTASDDALAAANAAVLAQPKGAGSSCAIVVDKVEPGTDKTRVKSFTCYETDAALAAANATSTALISWWVDANFRGAGTTVFGSFGPCDPDGYRINYVGNPWNDKITSFQTFNNCSRVLAYIDRDFLGGGTRYSGFSVPNVGAAMNDKISSFRLQSP